MNNTKKAIKSLFPLFLFLFFFFYPLSSKMALSAIGNDECLECHGTRDILQMSEEERLDMVVPTPTKKEVRKGKISLFVDYDRFRSSVHRNLRCVDCHTEIKEIPHPQRMGLPNCAKCHKGVMEQYTNSKHAKVSKRLCFECHNPHTTVSFKTLSREDRIKICLQCHKKDGHRWLPQRASHFHYLECTTCHAPLAKKALFLYFSTTTKDGKRAPLTYRELKKFATEYMGDVLKAIDFDQNGVVELHEIKRFLAKLKEGGIKSPSLEEEILITKPYHNYTNDVQHIKDCTMCHTSKAPFYSKILLKVPEKKGRWQTIQVKRSVIAKMPPIPTKDYYYSTVHGRNGVECVDCHADMTVLRKREGFKVKELGIPVCEQCHEDIMKEYKQSLHYKVSKKVCFSCHDPHSSIPFKQLDAKQRKAICEKCHKHAEARHDWLPQKKIHFRYLECTMCHSPRAQKGIVFYIRAFYKKGKEKRLSYKNISELLGKEKPNLVKLLDKDRNGLVEDREILSFLKLLNASKKKYGWKKIDLGVNVLVLKPSHNFTDRGTKAKDCAICHSRHAKFYSRLILELPELGGSIRTLPLEKDVLVAIHPIPVTSDFYLLGESRISKQDISDFLYVVRKIGYKWLDIIGLLFLVGGIAFVGIHGILRIITIPLRKGRRQKKGE